MKLNERIASFAELGRLLGEALKPGGDPRSDMIRSAVEQAGIQNPWFTKENCRFAMEALQKNLTVENLYTWLGGYPSLTDKTEDPLNIGVIMAGNIPLVGFHDLLCVLMSGNRIIAKPSSKDQVLMRAITDSLVTINDDWRDYIVITDGILTSFDAIIATGSNNSSRYFEYYFGRYPNIIRKNRNSVAVLTGDETRDHLKALGDDFFLYFGLGCRNVSSICVPSGYDMSELAGIFEKYSHYMYHNKYMNNYDYYKSIYLINKISYTDNIFFMLTENKSLASPISVIYFQYYNEKGKLLHELLEKKDQLQCIVSIDPEIPGGIPPGFTQLPRLWDYSDDVDTMDFLLQISGNRKK